MLRWLRRVGALIHRLVIDSAALLDAAYPAPIDAPAQDAQGEMLSRVQAMGIQPLNTGGDNDYQS